MSYLSMGFGIT